MTIKDIVKKLEEIGMTVETYQRWDTEGRKRGMLIRRINGMHFKGSKGNEYARALVGASLSQYHQEQMVRLNKPKGPSNVNKKAPSKRKREPIPEDIQSQLRRIQRLYRKEGKEYGIPTTAKWRYNVKEFGETKAREMLNKAEQYVKGIAYEENINFLISRIQTFHDKVLHNFPESANKLANVLNKIALFPKDSFLQDWLNQLNLDFYEVEKAGNTEDADIIETAVNDFEAKVRYLLSYGSKNRKKKLQN